MAREVLPINHVLLRWAREEAGLSLEEAAYKARVSPIKPRGKKPGATPDERLLAWEKGIACPSLEQLEALAKAYRRPTLTFFLPAPPVQRSSLADFRTIADKVQHKDSPEFAAFKRRLEVLIETLADLAREEEKEALSFVGSLTLDTPVTVMAGEIRRVLNFSLQEQEELDNSESLLRVLRRKAQDAGIYVLIEGDLGSSHSKIFPEEFRGVAYSNPIAPLVVINPNDVKPAQIFTFVHEICHLFLGESGISNVDAWQPTRNLHGNREAYCNAVAAEFLVPEDVIRPIWQDHAKQELAAVVSLFAKKFKVSRMVVARRLSDLDVIPDSEYWSLMRIYRTDWERNSQRRREEPGGPSRNTLDRFRLGDKLITTFFSAADEGRLSLQDVARILRVRVSRFDRIVQ